MLRNTDIERNTSIETVCDLMDHWAEAAPERCFLISPETGRAVTFKELREQARILNGRFQSLGFQRGDKIAFLMDNGLFTAQLYLATLYGGFVTVPLNTRAGTTQLSYTLDHCDAKLVFAEPQYDMLIQDILAQVGRSIELVFAANDTGPADESPAITTASS